MPQYFVIARDGTDAAAKSRRLAARPAHLAAVTAFVESGNIVIGGALLDAAGEMAGSVLMADFPTRAAFDAWLANDPYVTGKVWQEIEVMPMRIAVRAKTP